MKLISTTVFEAAPWTKYKVKLFIYSDDESFFAAHEKCCGWRDEVVEAFALHPQKVRNDILAEMHFERGYMSLEVIAHEALHVVLLLARYLRINLDYQPGEELLAEAIGHIQREVLSFQRSIPTTRQPSKRRPRYCGLRPD